MGQVICYGNTGEPFKRAKADQCPICGGDDCSYPGVPYPRIPTVYSGEPIKYAGICHSCGARWRQLYELFGIEVDSDTIGAPVEQGV